VPPDLLLHLVEPADWRTALASGAVRSPSLDSVGFVHLSTPEQVHLPGERLYPGRRDLVLLLVDPSRLTDPVRMEPGVPADPGGMLFPHLYGPLPVQAVVAVVPYRPPAPPVLPAADDALGRALAFFSSLPVRRAAAVRDVPGGVAVLDPDVPHSRDNNRLLLTEPVDAATVEASAAEVARDAGWPHQAATLLWPDAADIAAELGRRGWEVEELLLMARRSGERSAEAVAAGARAEVVDQREMHAFWDRSWRQNLADLGPRLDEVVADLVGREHLNDRVVAVTDLVVREAGRVVASGQLRVDGATAAVDSVLTDPDARGRGHADAVLARALDLAAAAGCDLVVLEAAGDDWPRHWYARRGFSEVGSVWGADRPA
jgi:uncharacterized protein (DUF952 family)/ribosomal protein S18 acetylase RimI-like enzyme